MLRKGAPEFLYQLLAERPAEANISHREMPSFEKHVAFMERRAYRAWFLVENEEGEWVGALNVTNQNEIGIFIGKAFWKRGYASQAIAQLNRQLEPLPEVASVRVGKWLANVAPENEASHALFKGVGGRAVQITYVLP